MESINEIQTALERLRDITRILREPGGCDWDRAQDLFSMREYLLEEAHEVIDAITRRHDEDLKEELGDLLFLVFFLSRLNEEAGRFHLGHVAEGMSEKLIRRHPHVFGDAQVGGVDDVIANWERIKEGERRAKDAAGALPQKEGGATGDSTGETTARRAKSVLKDTKKFLPGLSRAYKVQEKVAGVGFDWPDPAGVIAKLREELEELAVEMKAFAEDGREAGTDNDDARRDRLEDEAGDVLFACVNLLRHLKVHPEAALHRSVEKFARRFRALEDRLADMGRTPSESTLEEMDRIWDAVKASEPDRSEPGHPLSGRASGAAGSDVAASEGRGP